MLVSYRYNFIFLKTIKTASTSIFNFLIPYCIPSYLKLENYYLEKNDDDYLGFWPTGIVGNIIAHRKENKRHVSCLKAKEILSKIDKEIWPNYFKFCVVRNPWDICVSNFMWRKRCNYNKNLNFESFLDKLKSEKSGFDIRQDVYKLGGKKEKYVCNFHVKYENLREDLQKTFELCKIPNFNLDNLPYCKSNFRDKSIHYSTYYNDKTKKIVEELYSDDIEYFNYKFERT